MCGYIVNTFFSEYEDLCLTFIINARYVFESNVNVKVQQHEHETMKINPRNIRPPIFSCPGTSVYEHNMMI